MILNERIASRADYGSIKTILLIGAQITEGLYNKLSEHFKAETILNGYGPTEFTVYSHVKKFKFTKELDFDGINTSIGNTLLNVRSEIVKDGKILGAFEEGELCLAGPQIMTCYTGDQEKTKNALIELDGDVFYKTGDISYKDKNDEYYIIGRLDDTIKYRGYRINLLDINSYISKLGYIEDVITISVPNEVKENITIGFIVLKDKSITEDKIRNDLSKIVLDYQIPEELFFLDVFPVNSSGKISKKDLINYYVSLEK
jgi:acyl-coenzyme A synthetase/AMP-(fatty) acid ligase